VGTEGKCCAVTTCGQIEEQETEVANERIDLAGVFRQAQEEQIRCAVAGRRALLVSMMEHSGSCIPDMSGLTDTCVIVMDM
jgi:hypothetical protein